MRAITSFTTFLAESESTELATTERLFRLGLLDNEQRLRAIIQLLNSGKLTQQDLKTLTLPILSINDPYSDDDDDDEDEDGDSWLSPWLKRWRGPGGLSVAAAQGDMHEDGFDITIWLTNGDRIRAYWSEMQGWIEFTLERKGRTYRIADENLAWEELDREHPDSENTDEFFLYWLTKLVNEADLESKK